MLIGLSGTGPRWIALNRPPPPTPPSPPQPPFEQLAPGVKTGTDFRGQGPVVRKAVNAFHWQEIILFNTVRCVVNTLRGKKITSC